MRVTWVSNLERMVDLLKIMRHRSMFSANLQINRPLAAVHELSRNLWSAGWDFVFPPACLACGIALPGTHVEQRPQFCALCRQDLTVHADQFGCRRCGAPMGPYADSDHGCQECRRESFAFRTVYRLGIYDGAVKEVVIRSKYLGHEPLLMALAELIWEYTGTSMREAGISLVVPIPQHWRQRLISRHHTPEILAEAWGRHLQVPVGLPILGKVRWTRKQARLNRTERHQNQHSVFRVTRPDAVRGQTVLLVDDVMTTGATAHSAARALKAARAKQVIVAVIARVLGHR